MRFETLAVHAGHAPDGSTGAISPPIHLSTTFERAVDGSFPSGFVYIRDGNPNRQMLETSLAALEAGAAAAAFASGMAATHAILQALSPGDRVILPDDAYYGTPRLLREVFARWGLVHVPVNLTDLAALDRALNTPTRLVWIETPSNPLLRITDVAAVADRAHRAGALVACDNTWASPALTRPLALGADLVMHSSTKYLGGHSDVQGGVVVGRGDDEFFGRIRLTQVHGGGVPSPFDSWLILRGARTLACRMRAHCEHAQRVADFLSQHRGVSSVHYPGLSSHPGHHVAARQMSAFGGMLSFEVPGGRAAALAVAGRLRLITRATSLGGTESLIEHRASVEGPQTRAPEGLLRMSVGLEHPDDIVTDLDQALSAP
ncbi:MAG TPA: aminotransferase class I/II-fold pyridoxal phosphate-dependent enzyme [Gemmatimonadales bacterium]|nr:aminotransferase class I/II-fold pyridoxal phosphate-dependent enzyme [Gemmatimonadales bacterium]